MPSFDSMIHHARRPLGWLLCAVAFTLPAYAVGDSWVQINRADENFVTMGTDNQGTLYVVNRDTAGYTHLKKSRDGGANWTAMTTPLEPAIPIYSLTTDPNGNVYAATYKGIFKSSDGGTSWFSVNTGLPTFPDLTGAAITADTQGNLYVASSYYYAYPSTSPYSYCNNCSTVFRSQDGGTSWQMIYTPVYSFMTSLISDTQGNVYLANDFIVGGDRAPSPFIGRSQSGVPRGTLGTVAYGSISKWANSSQHWQDAGTAQENYSDARSLALDTAGTLYASVAQQIDGSYALAYHIITSHDGGVTWADLSGALPAGYTITKLLTDQQGSLYAQVDYRTSQTDYNHLYSLYKTTDQGLNWVKLANDMPSPGFTILPLGLKNPLIDSQGRIYQASQDGLYRYSPTGEYSIGGTASGTSKAPTLSAAITIATADANQSNQLYAVAALPDGRLYAITPANWLPLNLPAIQPYGSANPGTNTFTILNGSLDFSAYKGTAIYAGYGTDVNDMLSKHKYALIYTVQ